MLSTLWFLIKWIIGFFLIVSLLQSLITHFVLWFELRLKSLQGELAGKIPVLSIIQSYFIEAACLFVRFLMLPFMCFSKREIVEPDTTKTPLLLVHGYLQNQGDWFWFKRKLQQNPEIGTIYTLNLPPLWSIKRYALLLKKEIESIKAETKQNKIILVGHSMGGLICSYYSEYVAKAGEVEKVITIGTPFQGTRLVALGWGESVKEMSPASSFLSQLATRMQESSVTYHHVVSQMDNLIIPWQSAFPPHNKIEENKNSLLIKNYGHLRLLISPMVVRQVADWIRS